MYNVKKHISWHHLIGLILLIGSYGTLVLVKDENVFTLIARFAFGLSFNVLILPDIFHSLKNWQYVGSLKLLRAIMIGQSSLESNLDSKDFIKYPKFMISLLSVLLFAFVVAMDYLGYLVITSRG